MESTNKVKLLRDYMAQQNIPAVVIRRQANFSWLTGGGRGFIGLASEMACGNLIVTPDRLVLAANNIESPRLLAEELPDTFESESVFWAEDGHIKDVFASVCPQGYKEDAELGEFFASNRTLLSEEEIARFRSLGRDTELCMWEAVRDIAPGITEWEMAGRLSAAMWSRGIEPITLLVAADTRSNRVRHYVPTSGTAHDGLIFSVCARRGGLIASATRTVAFAPDFARDYERLVKVEVAALRATVPGRTMGQAFVDICRAYDSVGMTDEWKNHHQGGLTGYVPREIRADTSTAHVIRAGEAYAWNPSCVGAKCEDTVLITENGVEILTAGGGWPTVEIDGMLRPAILHK